MDGKDVWRYWKNFEAKAQPLRDEYEAIGRSTALTQEAKDELRNHLQQQHSELHQTFIRKASEGLPQVEDEARSAVPQALEAQAAARHPQQAIDARNLATGAPSRDLKSYVTESRKGRSLSKAHGLRQAIIANDQLEDTQKAELLESLDSISADTTERAVAKLVGYKVALAGLEGSGSIETPSAVLRDPVAALTAFREAGGVPVGVGGETRQLTEPEIMRCLEISGVPAHAPGGGPSAS
jgi:hypothetical protein